MHNKNSNLQHSSQAWLLWFTDKYIYRERVHQRATLQMTSITVPRLKKYFKKIVFDRIKYFILSCNTGFNFFV